MAPDHAAMTDEVCILRHYTGKLYLTNICREIRQLQRTGYWKVLFPGVYTQIR